MNLINSLIIEGKILGNPAIIEEGEVKTLRFQIEYSRFYENKEGEKVEETSSFICEVFGVFTEEKYVKHFKDGRGIRIVGRLKQYKTEVPYTCIVCEHVEFKPMIKK